MEKSVVIPYDIFTKMGKSSYETDNLTRYEMELRNILDDKKLQHDEKKLLYTQLLDKYVKSVRNYRSDIVLDITDKKDPSNISKTNIGDSETSSQLPKFETTPENKDDYIKRFMIKSLAPSKIKPASNLYDYLTNLPTVTWDDKTNEIAIDGDSVKDSNLIDIINDLVTRNSRFIDKRKEPPPGTYKLLDHLFQLNIPKVLIPNTARYKSNLNLPSIDLNEPKKLVKRLQKSPSPIVKSKHKKFSWTTIDEK